MAAMFDVKKVAEEAQEEIREEAAAKAKARIKDKVRQIHAAEAIVANLKRELDDIYAAIGEGN